MTRQRGRATGIGIISRSRRRAVCHYVPQSLREFQLDRNQAIDLRIAREPDHTHAASADGALNLVTADHGVNGVRHSTGRQSATLDWMMLSRPIVVSDRRRTRMLRFGE